MAAFREKFFSENDFEAVLPTFCCYDYSANASKAIEKITIDQKDYRRCPLCVIVCCIAKAYIINNSKKGWLQWHLQRSFKNFRSCTEKGAITCWPMMSFIHSGSEIRIYRVSIGSRLDGV